MCAINGEVAQVRNRQWRGKLVVIWRHGGQGSASSTYSRTGFSRRGAAPNQLFMVGYTTVESIHTCRQCPWGNMGEKERLHVGFAHNLPVSLRPAALGVNTMGQHTWL